MPSPFPGMNPYLEQAEDWQDFHTEFLVTLRHQLVPQLVPGYSARMEEHLYLTDAPAEPRRLFGRSDVAVARDPGAADRPALATIEAPAVVTLPVLDYVRVRYLKIWGHRGRDLVAVIELLSPSNKRAGNVRESYLAKRAELLQSPVNFVEIDLLRGWTPTPAEGRTPAAYSVLVARGHRRQHAEFWPIGLREPLPTIPIPLREPDGDARVDLQAVLHQAYDRAGYDHYIYKGKPEPALSSEDAAWARQFVPAARGVG